MHRLDNPYLTLFQFLELRLDKQTIKESLEELRELNKNANNQVIEERTKVIEDYVNENFSEDIQNDNTRAIQGSILLALKVQIK